MRIPSGVTDQYIYFVAVDVNDLTTRETGLSSFTVYRSRNGGAAAAMTTPTINETDATNMPGVYELLLDEDMTIDAGDDSQEMCFHITQASMAPVTRTIELYRPKITAGSTATITAGGRIDANVEAINNDTDAADKLAATSLETLPVTFSNGGSTTSAVLNQVDGAGASATDDVYNGRILVFNNGTLNHQVAEITDYVGATTTATISAVTTAPTSTHTARMI